MNKPKGGPEPYNDNPWVVGGGPPWSGLSEGWWLRLQAHDDLEVAKCELGPRLTKECRVLPKGNGRLMVNCVI